MLLTRLQSNNDRLELQTGDDVIIYNPNDIATILKPQPAVYKVLSVDGHAATIRSEKEIRIVSINKLKKLPKAQPVALTVASGDA
ncbi:MAG: hypothetical protein KVP17_002037 [Porospora cf. gigantea B]|nr:MAG: hypothetical protein KVP17_002037 [Porospora cf. gigantea B]